MSSPIWLDRLKRWRREKRLARREQEFAQTIAPEFDRAYYIARYPDVDAAAIDPLLHYVRYGWREGRDPTSEFSTLKYLTANPDVAQSGMNPLLHYVTWGRSEGRGKHPVGADGRGFRIRRNRSAILVKHRALRELVELPERPSARTPGEFDPKQMDIHWVVPNFKPGSGGHMTIFRTVRWLELFGHHCTIWLANQQNERRPALLAHETMTKYFQTVRAEVRAAEDGLSSAEGDAVFATAWETAPMVSHARGFRRRFYFVQDFEPAFHPVGAASLAAEETYRFDMDCICAGPWLEEKMRERGRWARSFPLAADRQIYKVERRQRSSRPKIAFYCRESPRRAVELGLLALEQLAKRGIEFEVQLFGNVGLPIKEAPFEAVEHGVLDPDELARLYNECAVGICFSATNYSLVPQEMMACGCAVMEIDGDSTRAVFPEGVVTRARPHPLAIADALERLLTDSEARARQIAAALEWVEQFSWESSARAVETALVDRLSEVGNLPRVRTVPSREIATVVIPTFNGGELFRRVLGQVRGQRAPWNFKVLVVDSSSDDGTEEYCRSIPDVQFESVKKSEFGHGKTRNLAVSMCSSPFVAFLTQDAMPADEFWLYNIVTGLEYYENAAGAFGRHIAWPDASPFVRRDMERHFSQFLQQPLEVSKETDRDRWDAMDVRWRQLLHFYSDNNSCLRRSVWESIPLPDIEYGEDQVWAQRIIENNYSKVYAPSAAVFHSHDYGPEDARRRAFTEAAFFAVNFGYRIVNPDELDREIGLRNQRDRAWASAHGIAQEEIDRRMIVNESTVRGAAEAIVAQRQRRR